MSEHDFKSVSMRGKFNQARVRVLWREGLLRAYGFDGLLLEVKTMEPMRMQGYLNSWLVDSDLGPLILKGRCITCGGPKWWRVMRKSANDLWGSV